jgi:hypothetical protein
MKNIYKYWFYNTNTLISYTYHIQTDEDQRQREKSFKQQDKKWCITSIKEQRLVTRYASQKIMT